MLQSAGEEGSIERSRQKAELRRPTPLQRLDPRTSSTELSDSHQLNQSISASIHSPSHQELTAHSLTHTHRSPDPASDPCVCNGLKGTLCPVH